MKQVLINDVVNAIEEAFPPARQESFDNSGLQVGLEMDRCKGVLLCVDVTPEIVVEAAERGRNLIIAHHPLIFHPLSTISRLHRVDITIAKAIRNEVAIYSCHTPVDRAPRLGVSWHMGRALGLLDISVLENSDPDGWGLGVVGNLPEPLTPHQLAQRIKETFGSPAARCSNPSKAARHISRVALCGGSGASLIPRAIEAGAQAFITSDCKHNEFIDRLGRIFLIDIGHYEAEQCTKDIFLKIITEKFPNFAVDFSLSEHNPITYI